MNLISLLILLGIIKLGILVYIIKTKCFITNKKSNLAQIIQNQNYNPLKH
jgi:branched-subunit amino acid transport protein